MVLICNQKLHIISNNKYLIIRKVRVKHFNSLLINK